MRVALSLLIAVALMPDRVAARQKFIEGIFMETEDGSPVEMIAWAESLRSGVLVMERGSLEDAPVVPRTYRILMSLGGWQVVNVLAVNSEVFSKPLDRLESRVFPVRRYRVSIDRFEHSVPELEAWENVQRLRKSLKASEQHPLVMFLVVTNGAVTRLYPFFVDR